MFVLLILVMLILVVLVVSLLITTRLRQKDASPTAPQTEEEFFAALTKSYKEALKKKPKISFSIEKLGFDPLKAPCLERFKPCQNQTQCIFAKTAKLAGAREWDTSKSIEENIKANADVLEDFLKVGLTSHLDGLLIQIRGREYGDTVDNFAETVRRVLTTFSDCDPKGYHCMRKTFVDKKGWYFEYAGESIFVTCFAPCFPVNHSRYQFEADPESCWILMQPEYSFTWHDLPLDSPYTNWDSPKNVRDRIRVEFKKANREYEIPATVSYPPAHHIVPPLKIGDPVVDFWVPKEDRLKKRASPIASDRAD